MRSYKLIFNGPGKAGEVPGGRNFPSLAGALATGWLIHINNGEVFRIESAPGVAVFDMGELARAFARLDALEAERAEGDQLAWAGRVIREMGKDEATG